MSISITSQSHRREHAAESRSTSAGSHKSGEQRHAAVGKSNLPEYQYPVPFTVRNTFINAAVGRPYSLEEFYEERRIHSSPVEPLEHHDIPKSPEASSLQQAMAAGAQSFVANLAAAAGLWMATPTGSENEMPHETGAEFALLQQNPCVLRLSDALPEFTAGAPDVPTIGSAGHFAGACKPCAFLYTTGCDNGQQCTFCHLCPPDEKKRRQKEKQAAIRDMRRQRRQVRL